MDDLGRGNTTPHAPSVSFCLPSPRLEVSSTLQRQADPRRSGPLTDVPHAEVLTRGPHGHLCPRLLEVPGRAASSHCVRTGSCPSLSHFLIVAAQGSSGTRHQKQLPICGSGPHPSVPRWLREVSIPTPAGSCDLPGDAPDSHTAPGPPPSPTRSTSCSKAAAARALATAPTFQPLQEEVGEQTV